MVSGGPPERLASGEGRPDLRPERIHLSPSGPAATGSKEVPERRRPLSAEATKAYLATLPRWGLEAAGRSLRRELQDAD